jgi:hypothetical protein
MQPINSIARKNPPPPFISYMKKKEEEAIIRFFFLFLYPSLAVGWARDTGSNPSESNTTA